MAEKKNRWCLLGTVAFNRTFTVYHQDFPCVCVPLSLIFLIFQLYRNTRLYVFTDDVAVIDEIQMLRDQQRGWAWTRALLGINAKEVHVCGEASAINLVQEMMMDTGDYVEEEVIL